jgi:hypothetical protein
MSPSEIPFQAARLVLALLAVAAMIPLSFVGYAVGGSIGSGIAEGLLGPPNGVVGLVVGSIVLGGASLLLPALVAVWLDKVLSRKFGRGRDGTLRS